MISCVLLIDKLRIIVNIQELLIIIFVAISILLIFYLLFNFNILNIISHISLFFISLLLFSINTTSETVFNFVDGIVTNTNIIDNYRVIVLKDKYDNINQLENKNVGYTKDTMGINNIQIKFENICFNTLDDLLTSLDDEDIEGALILQEQYDELINKDDYEIIYELKFQEEIETVEKELLGETTLIYVSGMDNYAPLSSTGRSDVNMVIGINTKTNQILLISIPRDYYVELADKNAMDKLTHAGIYGINTSIKTVENLLNIKTDYYVKINFASLETLIDKLGGIEVESEVGFVSGGVEFVKGVNYLISIDNSKIGIESLDLAKYYIENIKNPLITLPDTLPYENNAFHLFPILCEKRDELQKYLDENGVGTVIHYPIPPHKQECYKEWNNMSFPITEYIADHELSLPIGPSISFDEVVKVIRLINGFS